LSTRALKATQAAGSRNRMRLSTPFSVTTLTAAERPSWRNCLGERR
jgi:hypothetical protein